MGNFRLLAHPWWENLLLLVPLVAYFLFRREKPQLTRHHLLTSAIFALSFERALLRIEVTRSLVEEFLGKYLKATSAPDLDLIVRVDKK